MTSLQKLLIGRTSTHTMEKELPQSTKLWPQLTCMNKRVSVSLELG